MSDLHRQSCTFRGGRYSITVMSEAILHIGSSLALEAVTTFAVSHACHCLYRRAERLWAGLHIEGTS